MDIFGQINLLIDRDKNKGIMMQKFSLTSLSVLLSVILASCGSTSKIDDTSSNKPQDENISSPYYIEDDSIIIGGEESIYHSPENYQVLSISNTDRDRFLREINSARGTARSCGSSGYFPAVSTLSWSTELYEASYEHNYDMLNANTFSHDGSGTQYDITGVLIEQPSSPFNRVVRTGYFETANYYGIGENIAMGQQDIQEVVSYWLSDDLHCANIMRSDFTEMAISKVPSDHGNHWTNLLGYR